MTKILYYLMIRSSILKSLIDGIKEIETIQVKTQIEMNILLATLLELELTGTLENIRGQNIQSCCRAGHYCSLI